MSSQIILAAGVGVIGVILLSGIVLYAARIMAIYMVRNLDDQFKDEMNAHILSFSARLSRLEALFAKDMLSGGSLTSSILDEITPDSFPTQPEEFNEEG